MTPEFTIREAGSGDAAGILECLSEAFAAYRSLYSAGAYADTVLTADTLKQRMGEMTVLAAIAPDGSAIGTIALNGEPGGEGHLRGMAVRAAWHGHGVAARLLEEAEARLRMRGCRRVTLDTTEPLRRAIAFYRKHGYEPTGRAQDFFGMRLLEYAKDPG